MVRGGDTLLADASARLTLAALAEHVDQIVPVRVCEFAKAEGAISCKGHHLRRAGSRKMV